VSDDNFVVHCGFCGAYFSSAITVDECKKCGHSIDMKQYYAQAKDDVAKSETVTKKRRKKCQLQQ